MSEPLVSLVCACERDAARAGGGGVGAGAEYGNYELVIQEARRPTGRGSIWRGWTGFRAISMVSEPGRGQAPGVESGVAAVPGRDHRID